MTSFALHPSPATWSKRTHRSSPLGAEAAAPQVGGLWDRTACHGTQQSRGRVIPSPSRTPATRQARCNEPNPHRAASHPTSIQARARGRAEGAKRGPIVRASSLSANVSREPSTISIIGSIASATMSPDVAGKRARAECQRYVIPDHSPSSYVCRTWRASADAERFGTILPVRRSAGRACW